MVILLLAVIMKNEMNRKKNFLTLLSIVFSCIFIGGFIGGITNAINGRISPHYFQVVMGWEFNGFWTAKQLWYASIGQGIFEGLLYGVIFSIVFTTSYALITKGKGSYFFAFKQLLKIILIVLLCWAIGGVIAMFLSWLSPDFYQLHFYRVPEEQKEMLKYAWVGGSIGGGILGGLISMVLSVFTIKISWKNKNYC